MAIKPKKSLKEKYPIDETVEKFLLSGETEPGTQGHELRLSRFFSDTPISGIWREHKGRLLKKWKTVDTYKEGESWVERWLRHKRNPFQFYQDEVAKGNIFFKDGQRCYRPF